jgi:hypothetical protein
MRGEVREVLEKSAPGIFDHIEEGWLMTELTRATADLDKDAEYFLNDDRFNDSFALSIKAKKDSVAHAKTAMVWAIQQNKPAALKWCLEVNRKQAKIAIAYHTSISHTHPTPTPSLARAPHFSG